jgi:hypothetical protein
MKQVTLGHEDIEWWDESTVDDDYQTTLNDDQAFMAYVKSCKHMDEALEQAYKFHRHIANQLIRRGVRSPSHSAWGARTIFLCRLAKARRIEMHNMFLAVYGRTALQLELTRIANEYPPAIWGESL